MSYYFALKNKKNSLLQSNFVAITGRSVAFMYNNTYEILRGTEHKQPRAKEAPKSRPGQPRAETGLGKRTPENQEGALPDLPRTKKGPQKPPEEHPIDPNKTPRGPTKPQREVGESERSSPTSRAGKTHTSSQAEGTQEAPKTTQGVRPDAQKPLRGAPQDRQQPATSSQTQTTQNTSGRTP